MFLRRTKLLALEEEYVNIEVSVDDYSIQYYAPNEYVDRYWYEYYCTDNATITFTINGNKIPNNIHFKVSSGYTIRFHTGGESYWVQTQELGDYTIDPDGQMKISVINEKTSEWHEDGTDIFVSYSFRCKCYADPIIESGIKTNFTFSGDTYTEGYYPDDDNPDYDYPEYY